MLQCGDRCVMFDCIILNYMYIEFYGCEYVDFVVCLICLFKCLMFSNVDLSYVCCVCSLLCIEVGG